MRFNHKGTKKEEENANLTTVPKGRLCTDTEEDEIKRQDEPDKQVITGNIKRNITVFCDDGVVFSREGAIKMSIKGLRRWPEK